MKTELDRLEVINRNGFVMPVVILAMVVLGALALAAMSTANDEVRSSRAMRESSTALYAAEAGANLLLATVVDSPDTVLDTLAANMSPGDSVDLGWTTLSTGAAYRAVFRKYTDDTYVLNVTGRNVGLRPSEQSISYALAGGPGGGIVILGAISGDGDDMYVTNATVSGFDTRPAGWGGCPPEQDGPAITWYNDNNVLVDNGTILGSPPIVENDTIDPFVWGSLTYDMLVDSATIIYGGDADITVGPRISSGACQEHPRNWGDPLNPSGLCHDRFPIIHIGGKLTLYGYGQGILLVDGDIDLKEDVEFYGLIASKGNLYVGPDVTVHGAIAGGTYIHVTDAPGVFYSSCALTRAFGDMVEAIEDTTAAGGPIALLDTRPWSSFLR